MAADYRTRTDSTAIETGKLQTGQVTTTVSAGLLLLTFLGLLTIGSALGCAAPRIAKLLLDKLALHRHDSKELLDADPSQFRDEEDRRAADLSGVVMHGDLTDTVPGVVRAHDKLRVQVRKVPDVRRDFLDGRAPDQPEARIHVAIGNLEGEPQEEVESPGKPDPVERIFSGTLDSKNDVEVAPVRLQSPKIDGGELIIGIDDEEPGLGGVLHRIQ